MKKTILTLAAIAALAMSVLTAGSAAAGVDCSKPKFANHPQCTTQPPATTTTTIPEPDPKCSVEVHDLASAEPVAIGDECIDVVYEFDARWAFDVTITGSRRGKVHRVYLSIREQDTGAFCWVFIGDPRQLGTHEGGAVTFTVETPDPIPASAPGVCSGNPAEDPTESLVVKLALHNGPTSRVAIRTVIRPVLE